ncbi:MAG: RecQ family ATP-dependent DNA helicase [Prevotellaceae bacterium]|nr:RecQ family ATP-dependent DNA helicase [Prevotellaceae bacterium]
MEQDDKYRKILERYWGYTQFRSLQEDIIRAVAEERRDTLALMPTGGGKSITFQVPALAMEGICLVVTPLIALMKDQVENLRKRGVKTLLIHSGMTSREIDVTLNNAVFGNFKFLYLSPERLGTELFLARLQKMKVCLIAVDESHCISQWGYDFRPSYLRIADIRPLLPGVPVLALTATATPQVTADIMEKLRFGAPHLLKKSFERSNLVYVVRTVKAKESYLVNIFRKEQGTGIVYVRNRGETKATAHALSCAGISADFYHAGLSPEVRAAKQDDWKSGKTRVIVATNAFGMGIDKPDVRAVVHIDLPDSVEAYFQEAGRAGRDGKRAYAVLLYSENDRYKAAMRFRHGFPSPELIKKIYQAVCSHLQIPYGAGKGGAYSFDMIEFVIKYRYHALAVMSAFSFLARENIAELTDEINNPSRLLFLVNRDDLYKIQINNPDLDILIRTLLRTYTGLFTEFTNIDEEYLARILSKSRDDIYHLLSRLSRMKIAEYIPKRRSPMLIMHEERLDSNNIRISAQNFGEAKKRFITRMDAMLAYAENSKICRSVSLLNYFGESDAKPCGQCDVCRSGNSEKAARQKSDRIREQIRARLRQSPVETDKLISGFDDQEAAIRIIREMMEKGEIVEKGKLIMNC